MQDKGVNPNEKYLFHGTKNNDPQIIYANKENGFDLRLSGQGMWGRGIYFAENASYSGGGYQYKKSDGSNVLIVTRVLIGETFKCESDPSLTRPPLKNDKITHYDSVEGYTGNSVVYIIYDNLQAYPEYLIHYQ